MKMRFNKILIPTVGIIFIAAAVYKFLDLMSFAFGLINSNIFPEFIAVYLTYLVPIFEMSLGLLLLFFRSSKFLSDATISTLIIYSIFILIHQFTVLNRGCSCISFIGLELIPNLLFNFALTILLVFGGSKGESKIQNLVPKI